MESAGATTLYRGFVATMARDSLFGGVYSCLRHHMMCSWGPPRLLTASSHESPEKDACRVAGKQKADRWTSLNVFALNTLAACVAVAASSPLNYVRNMQLAVPPDSPAPRMLPLLRGLGEQVAQVSGSHAKIVILSRNLLLGWGSLRAALGMGFGSFVYDSCKGG